MWESASCVFSSYICFRRDDCLQVAGSSSEPRFEKRWCLLQLHSPGHFDEALLTLFVFGSKYPWIFHENYNSSHQKKAFISTKNCIQWHGVQETLHGLLPRSPLVGWSKLFIFIFLPKGRTRALVKSVQIMQVVWKCWRSRTESWQTTVFKDTGREREVCKKKG